jgi:hypothetical protein
VHVIPTTENTATFLYGSSSSNASMSEPAGVTPLGYLGMEGYLGRGDKARLVEPSANQLSPLLIWDLFPPLSLNLADFNLTSSIEFDLGKWWEGLNRVL